MSRNAATRSWWSTIGDLLAPWGVVGYVWWIGLHWTIIGLGVLYGTAALVAIGITIGEHRGR